MKKTELFYLDQKEITNLDFLDAFKNVGIKKGDILLVHSSLFAFGKLKLINKDGLMKIFLDILKDVVGPQGTIIMPTFSYSFCKNEIFDIKNTKSSVGVLTEFFRNQDDVLRTNHPIFSFSIWGNHKKYLSDIGKDSFGHDSVFEKFNQLGGKILFLGASINSCTFIHYVEQMYKVPYRFIKTFKGKINDAEKEYVEEVTFFVRPLDQSVTLDLTYLKLYLKEKGMLKSETLGSGEILLVGSSDLLRESFLKLDEDIKFLLKKDTNLVELK